MELKSTRPRGIPNNAETMVKSRPYMVLGVEWP